MIACGHALEGARIERIQARARTRERFAQVPDLLSSPCLAPTIQANVMVDGNHFRNGDSNENLSQKTFRNRCVSAF